MIQGTVSIKNIISKVIRDLRFQGDFPWQDAVEWGAEALQHIGAYIQFEKKCSRLTVYNYTVKMPCDFHQLVQLAYQGQPLTPGSGSFSNCLDSCYSKSFDVDLSIYSKHNENMLLIQIKAIEDAIAITTDPVVLRSLTESLNTKKADLLAIFNRQSTLSDILVKGNTTEIHQYWVHNNMLKTSFRDGTIMIAYMAIPTDEDGFPTIPDDISYREAIYRYITMKMMYSNYLRGDLRDKQWDEMVASWHYYCKQARGVGNAPDLGQLESIKNMWVRLIPNINRFDNFFNNLNSQEQINF